jgi:hypothetical protein
MPKMPLTKHDNMVKTIPSDRADQPLTIAILPWRSRRDWPIPNAHRPKTPDKDIAVAIVPIANEVAWPLLPATSLRQLATYPFGAWMRGCPKPQDFTAAVLTDQQPVEG